MSPCVRSRRITDSIVLQGLEGGPSSQRQPLGAFVRFFLLQMFGLPSLRDSYVAPRHRRPMHGC